MPMCLNCEWFFSSSLDHNQIGKCALTLNEIMGFCLMVFTAAPFIIISKRTKQYNNRFQWKYFAIFIFIRQNHIVGTVGIIYQIPWYARDSLNAKFCTPKCHKIFVNLSIQLYYTAYMANPYAKTRKSTPFCDNTSHTRTLTHSQIMRIDCTCIRSI